MSQGPKENKANTNEVVLDIKNLKVEFDTYGGIVKAVRGVNLQVRRAQTFAIVGESGCGKSVSMQTIMGLIPMPPGRITEGSVKLKGREILGLSTQEMNKIRGQDIAMIFQDPMTSLNPTMLVGSQIMETLIIHKGMSEADARNRAIELLEMVQIPEAAKRIDQYPFQFSGGMRQRVMIAMALACEPAVLIADEPTTALDVTIQSQILKLLSELQTRINTSIILITHDLGVVAQMADSVAVMYAGQVVESGSCEQIFYQSSHPYTLGLKAAMPDEKGSKNKRLVPIEGAPPDLFAPPKGCAYYARCPSAMKVCQNNPAPKFEVSSGHFANCWLHHDMAPKAANGLNAHTHADRS